MSVWQAPGSFGLPPGPNPPKEEELRIMVFASGEGTNFLSIIQKAWLYNYRVVGFFTDNPMCNAINIALDAGVPVSTLPKYGPDRCIHRDLLNIIEKMNPDLIVLAGYMKIISPEVLQGCPCPIINIHPSLLPDYKGLHAYERVLVSGDTEHGMTVHYVTEELDSGEIILQRRCPILPRDDVHTLSARVKQLEHTYYPMVIGAYNKMTKRIDIGRLQV